MTTLINPTRDLGDSRTTYGITALDLQLAPSLTEAWPLLVPHLADRTPIGVDIDIQLRNLDYELKRNDRVVAMPLGVELDSQGLPNADLAWLNAPSALERARAARAVARRRPPTVDGPLDTFTSADEGNGYLLARGWRPEYFHLDESASSFTSVLREQLQSKIAGIHLDERTCALIRALETRFDMPLLVAEPDRTVSDITAVLEPGARVCFTGTAIDDSGREWRRDDLIALAENHGLEPVKTVTKKRCDALIASEAGTMSGKGRSAAKYGTPVFTASQFLTWCDGR